MRTKQFLAIMVSIYLLVPIIVYILDTYLPKDMTIDPNNNRLCLQVADQRAKDHTNTEHRNDNFYKSCLLNIECIRLDGCPIPEIERLSNTWKRKD